MSWEVDLLESLYSDADRVQVPVSGKRVITVPAVSILSSSAKKISNRRSVLHLFQVNHCSIITLRLVSLTKDRIQRFIPVMCVMNISYRAAYHEFHSLNWVRASGSKLEKVGI